MGTISRIAAHQASLSVTNSQSSLKLTSIKSVMPSSLLLLPPIPPSIRVFSNESTLLMRWPKWLKYSGYPKVSNLYLPERKRSWPQSSIWISDATVWETVIFNRMIVGMGVYWHNGLPWWLSGKESAYQCRRLRFDPWIENIPWRRKWQPTTVFLLGKSHGQRSLVGYSPWGHKSQIWFSNYTTTYVNAEC